jgi:hypothetical protein
LNSSGTLPNLMATGPRGFLQWLRADQPGLYERALPILRTNVPQLWSDRIQSRVVTTLGRITRGLSGFGQDDDDDDDLTAAEGSFSEPVTVDLSTPDEDLTADTADIGSLDPSTTAGISSSISSALSGVDSGLANVIETVVGGQLQNAQAGLPPSSVSTAAAGQVSSPSSSTWLLVGGGLLALGVLAYALSG